MWGKRVTSPSVNFTEKCNFYVSVTFVHAGKIREHFIGILPVSKLVGTTLSARNIEKVLVEFFENMEVPISNCRFSCVDTTNVNAGDQGGLNRLLKHAVPLSVWIVCENHKLALCFKYLLGRSKYLRCRFVIIGNLEVFHYLPLAFNFLQDVAAVYLEQTHVKKSQNSL